VAPPLLIWSDRSPMWQFGFRISFGQFGSRTGTLVPLVYPNGVLLKFSRLSGIWLPDCALIEGSAEDVRKLLAENVKDSSNA
jgi:hypothetical protein